MNLVVIAFAVVLIVLLLYWIFAPWIAPTARANASDPLLRKLEKLNFDREVILANLADLESDRRMGKVTESDYQTLKSRMMVEAASIYTDLARLESEEPLLIQLEKFIQTKKGPGV